MFTKKSRNIYKVGSPCECAKAFFIGGIVVKNGVKHALPTEVQQLMKSRIVAMSVCEARNCCV
ncbi:hypothetical protein PTB13_21710, partial [Bacillus sp. MHSD17]|nr:hypothetical protein [Bacillus sp. MHSD17]